MTELTDAGKRLAEALVKADHEFKSHPTVFHPARRGDKTFEFRKDDRGGYHVGQIICLRCYAPEAGYTNDAPLYRIITDILRPGEFGLQDGYCILLLRPLNTAAASLRRPLEGDASLREVAAGLVAFWKRIGNGQHEKLDDLVRKAEAALARPQPEAKGPVAAGVIGEIEAERRRQMEAEGWTPEHDDQHANGEMLNAAVAYMQNGAGSAYPAPDGMVPTWWPWDKVWWKPKDRRRDLVRAAALIVAEIERLDRASGASTTPLAEAKTPDAGVGAPSLRDLFEAGEPDLPSRLASIVMAQFWANHALPDVNDYRYGHLQELFSAALTPTGSAGEDDTGVREAGLSPNWLAEEFASAEAEVAQWPPGLRASFGATHGAPQPPKAETPAGVGGDAEQRITNLSSALSSANRARGEQEARAKAADARRVELEQDRIHPALSVDVQEHRQQAYEGGWSDGYAEGAGKLAAVQAELDAALSTAPAARPGDEVERADAAMHAIWTEWIGFYNAHFRTVTGISVADQMAFYEIAQPILRALAAALAADGGRS